MTAINLPADDDQHAQLLSLAIVETCFRNTQLEALHAGVIPESATGDFSDVTVVTPAGKIAYLDTARISQDEMRALMIEAVNRVYTFLRHPQDLLRLGAAANWNRPELDQNLMRTVERRAALASGEDPAQVWADHPIKEPAVSVAPFRDRKAQPDDLLELANATVNDAGWIARAKAVMIAAADVWTWDRIALDDLDFIPDAHGN